MGQVSLLYIENDVTRKKVFRMVDLLVGVIGNNATKFPIIRDTGPATSKSEAVTIVNITGVRGAMKCSDVLPL